MKTRTELFAMLVRHFGSQRKMARALCVTDGAVSQWIKAERVPPASAITIERMLGNSAVRAVDLVGE